MGRREITTAVTMSVLCGMLVIGAVLGWKQLFAELPEATTSAEEPELTCTIERVGAGQRIRSSQVTVSVFNGGTRAGLADDTMSALGDRGFMLGDIGNAPTDANVRRVAIWSTEENDAEALLVARQFGKDVRVKFSDVDLGPGVDVVVGDGFRGLVKAKRSIKVRSPEEVCIQPESAEVGADAAG